MKRFRFLEFLEFLVFLAPALVFAQPAGGPTSVGTAIQKGDGFGGFAAAVDGTDYVSPTTGGDTYIKKDGTTTTTAAIPFKTLGDAAVKIISNASDDVKGWLGGSDMAAWLQSAPGVGLNIGSPNGATYIYGHRASEGEPGISLIPDRGHIYLRGSDGFLDEWGGPSWDASDVYLLGGFGGGMTDGIVAIAATGDAIPAGARGNYALYVKGNAWVDGNIVANNLSTGSTLLKADASKNLVAAVAGTDYQAPLVAADASHNGYLTSTDWSTFNGKLSASGTAADSDKLDGQHGSYYKTAKDTFLAKTVDYTLIATDEIVTGGGSSNITLTLPTAVGVTGKRYTIKNIGTAIVTVGTTSAQTIDGATTYAIRTTYSGITVVSDNANWLVVGVF